MFKNKKKSDKINRLLEELPEITQSPDEIPSSKIEETSIFPSNQLTIDEEVVAILEQDKKDEKEMTKSDFQEIQDDAQKTNDGEESLGWIWYDSPDFVFRIEPSNNTEKETDTRYSELIESNKDSTIKKVELQSFFKKEIDKKKKRPSKKELKKMKNQDQNKISDDIVNIKIFRYKKKKYKKVEDFISYLDDHYLDIDEIARDVLKNEAFFGWVGNQSGIFPNSLEEFKKIKSLIEEKD